MGGTCSIDERGQKIVQGLVGNPEGKIPLRKLRCSWEDVIRMYLREIGWGV
jgi:hypothetical protein